MRTKSSPPRRVTRASAQDNDLDSVELLTNTQSSSLPTTPEDDISWEDEPDYNLARPDERSPLSTSRSNGSVRKRKAVSTTRKIFVAQPNNNRRFPSAKTKGNLKEDMPPLIDIDSRQIRGAFRDSTHYTVAYALDVFKTALWLLRKPLSIIMFLYMLAFLMTWMSAAFRTVFSPVCWLPIVSRSSLCYTPARAPGVPKWADYPKLVEVETNTLEKLLDESVGGSGLSLEIKKAEMATSDLVTLVKVSDLKSKNRLAEHLETFIADSKKTGKALQRLSSRVGGAVDSITAVNEHALQTIQASQVKSLASIILYPISKGVAAKELIASTFAESMSVLETQIARIRVEAEASSIYLNNLEESLVTLHELLTRENTTLTTEKEELLAELWTILGGNKKKLKGMNNHLWLLKRIGDWRMRAQVHVVATMQALDAMSEDMEDLRERVSRPELIGESISAEVHIKTIQAGLERLQSDRRRAKDREDQNLQKALSIDGMVDD